MTDTRKVQLGAEFDASGVRKGTQEAKDAVRDMAQAVQASGQQAAKGLDGIGAGAEAAAQKLDRNTRGIAASIERATAAAKAGAKGTADFYEALANQRGANLAALQPYLEQLRQVERAQKLAADGLGAMGVSANQTRAALRQLPAQFTDIFTSLSSGQAPLTVLIQQGGQIKDSFGGIGPALRGVASAISPAALGFGALAAAVAGLGLAYKQGSSEADEFRRALALTGNIAGTTVGQLSEVARTVALSVGTQGKAAEVLAQLAASGRVAGADIGKLAEAAIRLEREGGPAVAETVKQFAALGNDPLKAAISLNETTNFLTLAVYKQIKALTEQGRTFEAARVAQEAYATAGIQRTKELEQNLGSLERGWRGVSDWAKKAWDAMLNIGRPASLQDQLAGVEKKLAELQASRTVGRNAGRRQSTFDAEEGALQAQADALRETIKLQGRAATAVSERALATQQAIAADQKAAKAAADHGDALASARQVAGEWASAVQRFQALQAEASGSADNLSKAQREVVKYLQSPAYLQASQGMRQVALQAFFAAQAAEDLAEAEKKRARALADMERANERYVQGLDRSVEAARKQLETLQDEYIELTQGKAAREAVVQKRLDDAAAMARQVANGALWTEGLTAETQKLLDLADAQERVAEQRRRNTDQGAINEARRQTDAWQADLQRGLTDVFRQAFLQGGNFGKNFARGLAAEVQARLATALAEVLAGQALSAIGAAVLGGVSGSGGGGGAGSLLQSASTLQSAYNLYNGGGIWGAAYNSAALASALGLNSAAAYGAAIGTTNVAAGSQAAMLAAQTGEFGLAGTAATSSAAAGAGTGAASWLSSAGPYAALAALAISIGSSAYSRGFSSKTFDSKFLDVLSTDLQVNNKVLKGLGFSDKWAEILSGTAGVGKLFGRTAFKLEDQLLTGTLGQGGFEGQQQAIFKSSGGIFRSDKIKAFYDPVNAELQAVLSEGAKTVYDAAFKYGEALGLPTRALETVNTALSVKWTDDAKLNIEALKASLAQYEQDLVNAYGDAVSPLRRYGEDVVQTIARVSAAISGVNDVLRSIGVAAIEASVQGGQAAVALQDMFGGQGGLQQAAGSYLQNFFSEAEQKDLARAGIGRVLDQFGLAVPATRDAFRDLVSAQDLATDSGRKAFAALMSVADAFAAVTESAGVASQAATERANLQDQLDQLMGNQAALRERARSRIDPANLDLYDRIQALQDARAEADRQAQAEADRAAAARAAGAAWEQAQAAAQQAAAAAAAAWADALKSIQSEMDRLRGVTRSPAGTLSGAASEFAIASAQARAGDIDAAKRLPELSRAYEEAAKLMAGSADDLRIMRLRIAASLGETQRIAGRLAGVPGFASGGTFGGGARIVGERAPELEVTGPSRIYTFDQLLAAATSSGDGAELRALREELQATRRDLFDALLAVARNTGAAAATLDDAARGKRALTTTATP